MSDDSILFHARIVAGLTLRFTAEDYERAANCPLLDPKYRDHLLALTAYCRTLTKESPHA